MRSTHRVCRAIGLYQGGIRFQTGVASDSSNTQEKLFPTTGLIKDRASGTLNFDWNIARQALNITGQNAFGFTKADTHTDYLVPRIRQLQKRIGDFERVDGVVCIDRTQCKVVDQQIRRPCDFAGASGRIVVLPQLQLLHIQLGVDIHAEIDSGVVDPGIAVRGQVDKGLTGDFRQLVICQFNHLGLSGSAD